MAEINGDIKKSFGYLTDPVEAQQKEKKAKFAKMQAEQQSRAKSLFDQLEEQREVYADAKNSYYKAKSNNSKLKKQNKLYQSNAFIREKNQEKYDASTIEMKEAYATRDIELHRLQNFTDSYCSAQRFSMQISIFAD